MLFAVSQGIKRTAEYCGTSKFLITIRRDQKMSVDQGSRDKSSTPSKNWIWCLKIPMSMSTFSTNTINNFYITETAQLQTFCLQSDRKLFSTLGGRGEESIYNKNSLVSKVVTAIYQEDHFDWKSGDCFTVPQVFGANEAYERMLYRRTFNSYPIVFAHKLPNPINITCKIQINSYFCNRRMLVGPQECIHFNLLCIQSAYTTASANKAGILL